jgi:Uma2 family endonuclease
MISLVHSAHSIDLDGENMIIIQNATAEMYHRLANEDLKIEYDGERLFIHSPARIEHEKAVENLLFAFRRYFEENPIAVAVGSRHGLKLPSGKRPEPDILVIPREQIDPKSAIYEGIPLLVIEILFPSNRNHDLNEKRKWYVEAKIPEIWYIDLDTRELIQLFLENDQYIEEKNIGGDIKSKVLTNFTMDFDTLLEIIPS